MFGCPGGPHKLCNDKKRRDCCDRESQNQVFAGHSAFAVEVIDAWILVVSMACDAIAGRV